MSSVERAEPQAARTSNTVHVLAPSWPSVVERLRAMVARVTATEAATQVLVIVPTPGDTAALAAALRAAVPDCPPVVPLSSVRRARRLVAVAQPPIVVTTPGIALGLMQASALALGSLSGVALVAADELAADRPALDAVLAEVPRGVAKVLTCSSVTPFVDELVTAHLHGARRLDSSLRAPPQAAVAGPAIEVLPTRSGHPEGALADVLDLVDAPSAAIVPGNQALADAARVALTAMGYPAASPLAALAPDGATGGAALVVLLGAPTAEQLGAVRSGTPARIVALVAARERAVLASLAGAGELIPFAPAQSREGAAAAEEAMREGIRRDIRAKLPSREMLALEPLLDEFDALTVAGAVLRMHETQAAARTAARQAKPAEPREPAPARRDEPGLRAPGPRFREERGGDRPRQPRDRDRSGPPRGFSRGERDDRNRPPRGFSRGERDDRGGPPRGFSRGERDDRHRPPREFSRGERGERSAPPRGPRGGPRRGEPRS